jgi:hypothetical protein
VEEGERDRLVKVLRMFGSDHDGEVAAAARRAHLILQKHALDWDDLVIPVSQAKTRTDSRRQREREEPRYHHTHTDDEQDEAFLIRRAQQFLHFLTPWERDFLSSIAESLVEWGRLTERQRAVLDRIGNKLKLRGCW